MSTNVPSTTVRYEGIILYSLSLTKLISEFKNPPFRERSMLKRRKISFRKQYIFSYHPPGRNNRLQPYFLI
jgi:hypothetical protein